MHAVKLLHKLLKKSCELIDKRVSQTLFMAAETLMRNKELWILGIGRTLSSAAKVKHNIKRIDRLFGNKSLHRQGLSFYQGMTHLLLTNNKRPVIIIDWSGLTRCGAYYFLRASVAVGGRTLTLYDQAYSLTDYMNDKTHRQFLKTLNSLLPKDCCPIVITDAGFRNTWFRAVKNVGWDFIGRVRNKTLFSAENTGKWQLIKTLYKLAKTKAQYCGEVLLSKTNPLLCHLYLSKQRRKGRIKRNLAGKKIQSGVSKKHEAREREPWLITSSLSPQEMQAHQIMLLYKKRMQIEEAFRDLKNTRHGFSLRHCRSYKLERLNVALLIAALAMLALWILGTAAKQKLLHYSFQANTEKRRNVLSNFIIGWQLLIRDNIKFKKADLLHAINQIKLCTTTSF